MQMQLASSQRFVEVKRSKMYYIESGQGAPILFVHGMPTSSYLWRNIIPKMSDLGRCIAPDLIGMGASDKPDIEYTVFDHIEYLDAFIDSLQLKNITLVVHGWGSVIGFDYARRHPENVAAIVFYEAFIRPDMDWDTLSLPVQQLASSLKRADVSYRAIMKENYLVNKLLPNLALRKLTTQEMNDYRQPFQTVESRKPLWQYVQDMLLSDASSPVLNLIKNNSDWLQTAKQPKLMLYSIPGFFTTISTVQWAKTNLSHISFAEILHTLHLAQETEPELFSNLLRDWYLSTIAIKTPELV